MVRNHLQIDRPSLHTECRVGTKVDIERLVEEQVSSLEWLMRTSLAQSDGDGEGAVGVCSKHSSSAPASAGGATAGATAADTGEAPMPLPSSSPSTLPLDDAIDFFERSAVCLGQTALCLSGGGSLAMHRASCPPRPRPLAASSAALLTHSPSPHASQPDAPHQI
jgi:hypothetical protein